MSGSLSAANSLRVGDQQQQFLDMIDKGTVELQQAARDLRSSKVDALQQTVNDAMTGLSLPPLKSRTSVVKAALYLIDSGVLHIPILNIINVKQARAFLWNALWLQDVMNREWGLAKADEDAQSLANGFQLALMGPGGTGKTAVLRVTEALVTYFCGPDSVRKCAPTNAAARLLGGDTVHAACKLPFVDVPTSSPKARLSRAVLDRLRQQWQTVRATFIDEISMVIANKLLQSEVRMRSLKNPEQPFGGLGVTISGDFLQLPPILMGKDDLLLATSLDKLCNLDPDGDVNSEMDAFKPRKRLADSVEGVQIWQNIRRVVHLDVNIRAPGPLSRFLAEMRAGHLSDSMWKLYLTRVMQKNDPRLTAPDSPFSQHYWQFIVHRHKIRVYRSLANAKLDSAKAEVPLYILQAKDEAVNVNHAHRLCVPQVMAELLQRVNPKETCTLPSVLPLYVGMRVTLQSKDCVRLGIMKGCICVLRHIVFADREPFAAATGEDNMIHLKYMPVCLWLQACDAEWVLPANYFPVDMPPSTSRVGLFQFRPTTAYLTVRWEEETFKVRRTSYLLTPADTIITYGAQGSTFDAVIIDMRRPPCMPSDEHWLACYVMLSRSKSLEGLLILRPALRSELARKPPAYLLAELDRLRQLEEDSFPELVQRIARLQSEDSPPKLSAAVQSRVLHKDGALVQLQEVAIARGSATMSLESPALPRRRLTGKRNANCLYGNGCESMQHPSKRGRLENSHAKAGTATPPPTLSGDSTLQAAPAAAVSAGSNGNSNVSSTSASNASTTVSKPKPFCNLGQSCWINATVMAFFGSTVLRNELRRILDRDAELCAVIRPVATSPAGFEKECPFHILAPQITDDHRLAVTYELAMDQRYTPSSLVPYLFTHRYYAANPEQKDTHEFYLDVMAAAPILRSMSTVVLQPSLSCTTCNATRRTLESEPFTCLQLPVQREDHTLITTVQAAVNHYFEPEKLDDEFVWTCEVCRSQSPPSKAYTVSVFPSTLVIQLLRWQQGEGAGQSLNHAVQPDHELTVQNEQYVLRSIICHIGTGAASGHYTARIYHPTPSGTFWYYNDRVRRIATGDDLSTAIPILGTNEKSYIVFYDKKPAA